ncbi:MAG: transporter substrate-binding domain-containing protein [Pusillimonas sp.]
MLAKARWLVVLVLMMVLLPVATEVQARPLVIQLKWLHQFQSAGLYAALEKGYFAQEGLDVVLRERDPSRNMVTEVLDGAADYGVADSILLMHYASGQPVVLVAAFLQHSAGAIMTMGNSGLVAPADLVGRRVAFYDNDSDGIDVLAMLSSQKVLDQGLVRVPWAERMERLESGQIDGVAVYLTNEPFVMAERGHKVNLITPRHFGIDLYGDMLFTSQTEAQQNPERVEAMRRAVIRGWHYALDHKEEIVDLILRKYNTQNKSRDALLNEARALEVLIDRYTTPLGEINPQRVNFLYAKLRDLKLIHGAGNQPLALVFQSQLRGASLSLNSDEQRFLSGIKTVRYAIDEAGWPPFESLGADGRAQGIASDYLDLISRKLGIAFQRVSIPSWQAALDGVQAREIDLLPTAAQTPDRSRYMGFSTRYVTSPMVIVSRDDVDFIPDIAQLVGLRVGVVKGYASDELLTRFHPDVSLLRYGSTVDGLRRLAAGEVDVFVDNLAAAIHIIKIHGLANLKISGQTPYSFDLTMGVRNDWPLLLSAINKVLASMTAQEHNAIYDKWVALPVDTAFPWERVLPWLMALVLTVGVLLVYSVRMKVMNHRIQQTNDSLRLAEQALRDKNAQLLEASIRDKLTGTFNRHHLDAILGKEFERYQRFQCPFSIVMFDLDHFKRANDQFGHQAGDEVLLQFCKIVLQTVRDSDTFGRWGGEEFLLICPEATAQEAFVVADKVRQATEAATLYPGLRQTVSGGVKDSRGCASLDEQISGADNKLYEAKSAGRNRVMY